MKLSYLYIFLGISFFIFAALVLRPVPIPKDANELLVKKGQVVRIFEGGVNDVVFKFKGDKTSYYINRGLEYDLVLEDLQKELTGKEITVKYPEYWTPLDPNHKSKHLCILEFEGKELFNEINLVHYN